MCVMRVFRMSEHRRNDNRRVDRLVRHGAVRVMFRSDQVHVRLRGSARHDGCALHVIRSRAVSMRERRMMRRSRMLGRIRVHDALMCRRVMFGGRLVVSVR